MPFLFGAWEESFTIDETLARRRLTHPATKGRCYGSHNTRSKSLLLSPEPMVIDVITIVTKCTRISTLRRAGRAWLAGETAPSISGAYLVAMRPETSPPIHMTGMINQIASGGTHCAISAAVCPSKGALYPRISRNIPDAYFSPSKK